MTNTDNTDDLALLANTPDQAESLLHRIWQATGNIGLYRHADQTEFICF